MDPAENGTAAVLLATSMEPHRGSPAWIWILLEESRRILQVAEKEWPWNLAWNGAEHLGNGCQLINFMNIDQVLEKLLFGISFVYETVIENRTTFLLMQVVQYLNTRRLLSTAHSDRDPAGCHTSVCTCYRWLTAIGSVHQMVHHPR